MILKNLFSFLLRWMHLDPQIVICQVGLDLRAQGNIIIGTRVPVKVFLILPHQNLSRVSIDKDYEG